MEFPVQNEGTTSFRYPLIIEGCLEALMRKCNCKQSVHSRLCGNDMETSRGASAEIRGRHPETLMCGKELTDQDEMSNHNRGLSIDASCQVSVHLAKLFQRRRI